MADQQINDLIGSINKLVNAIDDDRRNNGKSSSSGERRYNSFGNDSRGLNGQIDELTRRINKLSHDSNVSNEYKIFKESQKNYKDALNNLATQQEKLERISEGATGAFGEFLDKQKERIKQESEIIQKEKAVADEKEKYQTEQLENEKARLDNQKKLVAYEIEVSAHNERLNKARADFYDQETEQGKKHLKERESIWKKEEAQYKKKIEIEHKQELIRARGINNNGKNNSFKEITDIIAQKFGGIAGDSIGRNIGKGVGSVIGGLNSGAGLLNSGSVNVGGLANTASSALSMAGPWGMAAGGLLQLVSQLFEMFSKVDKAASQYSREVGGGRMTMRKMETGISQRVANFQETSGWRVGNRTYDAADLIDRMREYSNEVGKTTEHLTLTSVFALKDLKDFGLNDSIISDFDTFGISVENTSERVANIYHEASKKGISAKKAITTMTSNLKMAQKYTFADGVKALDRMALRSTELKFNMQTAEQFANKVSTLEGAMKAGASLSVLGGNFAMNSNPLTMLYNSLNDVESLQNQMLEMVDGSTYFDHKKGHLEMSAFDRERFKAAAEGIGVDFQEMLNMAFNKEKERMILSQLRGKGFTEDEEKYIKNLAELNSDGDAVVSIKNEKGDYEDKKIDELTPAEKDELKKEYKAKNSDNNKNVYDILTNTMSIQERLDAILQAIKNQVVKLLFKIAGITDTEVGEFSGLDHNMADLYEAMSDDYHVGGASENLQKLLKELGASEDFIRKSDGKSLSQKEFDDAIIQLLLKKQSAGFGVKDHGNLSDAPTIRKVLEEGFQDKYKVNGVSAYEPLSALSNVNGTISMFGGTTNRANGGYISGIGGPKDDLIPARLSNGEFVMNAEATNRHRAELEAMNENRFANGTPSILSSIIRNGSNIMNFMPFSNMSSGIYNSNTNNKIEFEPLTLSGTIHLELGGVTKDVDSNVIANALMNNYDFVNMIITKVLNSQEFGRNKNDAQIKFPTPLFV